MSAPLLDLQPPTQQAFDPDVEPPLQGIYPKSWNFTDGDTGFGGPRMYWSLMPWAGAAGAPQIETTTGFSMRSAGAELHTGFFGLLPGDVSGGPAGTDVVPPVIASFITAPGAAAWPNRAFGSRLLVDPNPLCSPNFGAWCGQGDKVAIYQGNDAEVAYDYDTGTGSFAQHELATSSGGAALQFFLAESGATGRALVTVLSGTLATGEVITGNVGGATHTITVNIDTGPWFVLEWGSDLWSYLTPQDGWELLVVFTNQWLRYVGIYPGGSWLQIPAPSGGFGIPGASDFLIATGYADSTETSNDVYHWMYCPFEAEDVEVTNYAVLSRLDAVSPREDSVSFFGAGARIQGGSASSPTTVGGRLFDCDGYFMYFQNQDNLTGTDWQWVLLKVVNGVVTQLDERPDLLGVNRPAETQVYDSHIEAAVQTSRYVRLRVTTVAPNVRVEGWSTPRLVTGTAGAGFPAGGSGGFNPDIEPWISGKVFDFLDTSSPITGPGRCAFALGPGRVNTAANNARYRLHSTHFSIKDISSGNVVLDDHWERNNRPMARDADNDPAITQTSKDLRSLFTGGVYSITGFDNRLLLDGTSGDAIEAPATAGDEPGWHPWQLRTTSVFSQRFSADFTFPGSPTTGWLGFAGIFLRGAFTPTRLPESLEWNDSLDKTCYLAYVDHADATGIWHLHIYSYHNTQFTVIADATPLTAQVLLLLGTPFTLDFQVANIGGSTQAEGVPQLLVRVDGTEITPTLDSGVSPLDFQVVDNTIIDTRTQGGGMPGSIIGGTHVGLFLNSTVGGVGAGDRIVIDNWAEGIYVPGSGGGPGSDPPLPEADQASITVPSEGDDVSAAVLTLPLDWPVTLTTSFRLDRRMFDSGHVQTHTISGNLERRVWRVEAATSPETDINGLKGFWDARKGSQQGFVWVTPDPEFETVTVHFKDDTLETALTSQVSNVVGFGANTHYGRFTFELEEILT